MGTTATARSRAGAHASCRLRVHRAWRPTPYSQIGILLPAQFSIAFARLQTGGAKGSGNLNEADRCPGSRYRSRSRPLYNRAVLKGIRWKLDDGTAAQETVLDSMDEKNPLIRPLIRRGGRPAGRDHARVSDGRCPRGSTHDPGTSGLAFQGFLKARRGSRQVDICLEMDGRRQYLHPEDVEVVTIAQLSDDRSKLARD